jgi:hypothetical protein
MNEVPADLLLKHLLDVGQKCKDKSDLMRELARVYVMVQEDKVDRLRREMGL